MTEAMSLQKWLSDIGEVIAPECPHFDCVQSMQRIGYQASQYYGLEYAKFECPDHPLEAIEFSIFVGEPSVTYSIEFPTPDRYLPWR